MSNILDTFGEKISRLSSNVATLASKTSAVQREQTNARKLLAIVDATLQFHGKTLDFENTIKDPSALHSLDDYLEKMTSLREAVAFFASASAASSYRAQLAQMEAIFEAGCGYLEAEFGTLVRSKSVVLAAARVLERLDEEYGKRFLLLY